MVEWWVAASLAVLTAALGYLGHWLQARTATEDNSRTLANAQREADLATYRWAAEFAISQDRQQRAFAADQLSILVESPSLLPGDLRLVRAAIERALAPQLATWETEGPAGPPTDVEYED